MHLLSEASQFVHEMNLSNSTLEKKRILKNYESLKSLLNYVYDPFKQYNVTSKTCIKRNDLVNTDYAFTSDEALFNLLDALTSRKITGHKAIGAVNGFVAANAQYTDLIYSIIDKDLKCRVKSKVINAVFKKLIPVYDVALAYEVNKYKGNLFDGSYFASRKMDGLRCTVVVYPDHTIEIFSRTGKKFKTLGVIEDAVKALNITGVVFDGEACIVGEDGIEDFQAILREYNRKGHIIASPRYNMFDAIPIADFFNGYCATPMIVRQDNLRDILKNGDPTKLVQLDQIQITSEQQLKELDEMAAAKGWEGLILRKNTAYKSGRGFDLLKQKHFFDTEETITGYVLAPMRVIVNAKEVEEEMLSAVTIKYKGYTVSVGSGFSLAERREYYKNPESLIGKEMTVQYFEETVDKTGAVSLRFPTKKAIYDGKRDV